MHCRIIGLVGALLFMLLLGFSAHARTVNTLSIGNDPMNQVIDIVEAQSDGDGQPDNVTFAVTGTISGSASVSMGDGKSITGGGNIVLDGIPVSGANGSIITGLTVINCGGVGISVNSNCTVQGCKIGTDGTTAFPNNTSLISNGGCLRISGDHNTIGGVEPGQGNVISGNIRAGIVFSSASAFENVIIGNTIGMSADGLTPIPNTESGIRLKVGAHDNYLGSGLGGNLISGNTRWGILLEGDCDNCLIANNYIGISENNTAAGNGRDGIQLGADSDSNTIDGNIICANAQNGIALIGQDELNAPSANIIRGNLIGIFNDVAMANGGDGVRLDSYCDANYIGEANNGNIISGNTGNGVRLSNSSGNFVFANHIGTTEDGLTAIANGGDGVLVVFTSDANQIGFPDIGYRNIISGNTGNGISLNSFAVTNTVVRNNYIGVDELGTAALPNGKNGVAIGASAHDNEIGEEGLLTTYPNVISGNTQNGVFMTFTATKDNIVLANFIGTNATGTAAVANGDDGVHLEAQAGGNFIGKSLLGAGNVISGNDGDGIDISGVLTDVNQVVRNFIGTNLAGNAAIPNGGNGITISGGATQTTVGGALNTDFNLISGNTGAGVLIDGTGTDDNEVIGNIIGLDLNATADLGNGEDGVAITNAAESNDVIAKPIANVISGNAAAGVRIDGGVSNNIRGNYIGTDLTGTDAVGNGTFGVLVEGTAASNSIGGAVAGEGNQISGNFDDGVRVRGAASGTSLLKNIIGIDLAGNAALPNGGAGVGVTGSATGTFVNHNTISGNDGDGVYVLGPLATDTHVVSNWIGVSTAQVSVPNGGAGVLITESANNVIGANVQPNTIGANLDGGVHINGAGATGNTIQANFIGTDDTGNAAKPNTGYGVLIDGGAHGNGVGAAGAANRNLISGNTLGGIAISGTGSDSNTIANNFIGTDALGIAAIANNGPGILIEEGASNNAIGSGAANGADLNVIAGNAGDGIKIVDAATTGNTVRQNNIGLDFTGDAVLANGLDGIFIGGAPGNTIGAAIFDDYNLITGNNRGIRIAGTTATGNVVLGNFIGWFRALGPAANNGDGIRIETGASNNLIGGADPLATNYIINSGGEGVAVLDADSTGNTLRGNRIHNSFGKGIHLNLGNHDYPAPAIVSLTHQVAGTAAPNSTIDVFLDSENEGNVYFGTTDANSLGAWALVGDFTPYVGYNCTATATSPQVKGVATGQDTSEFSAPFPIACGGPSITCPNNIVVNVAEGVTSAQVSVPVATAAPGKPCDNAIFSLGNDFNNSADASGAYPLGVTTVAWLATDTEGRTDTCTMTVTVQVGASEGEGEGEGAMEGEGEGEGATEGEGEGEGEGQSCDVDHTGWIYNPTTAHWYKRLVAAPWADANAQAETFCAYLVAINDADENDWLFNDSGLLTAQDRVWIGLNDLDTEGVYVWTNGDTATYTNWAVGEPNNQGDEDYATIGGTQSDRPAVWNDDHPEEFRAAIVERDTDPGIGPEDGQQSADQNGDRVIQLAELLRVIQFYNSFGYHCADVPTDTEDGYVPGPGANHTCTPYDTDYNPQDWTIALAELLRVIQFYNSLGYHYCPFDATEDGFCPGP